MSTPTFYNAFVHYHGKVNPAILETADFAHMLELLNLYVKDSACAYVEIDEISAETGEIVWWHEYPVNE